MDNVAIYRVWERIKQVCDNKWHLSYPIYGGRGIRVCERWQLLENFVADMPPRPSPEHQLSLIDYNRDFEPGNVEWVTRSEHQQRRNAFFAKQRALQEMLLPEPVAPAPVINSRLSEATDDELWAELERRETLKKTIEPEPEPEPMEPSEVLFLEILQRNKPSLQGRGINVLRSIVLGECIREGLDAGLCATYISKHISKSRKSKGKHGGKPFPRSKSDNTTPVQCCRDIFERMKGASRDSIMAECERQGIYRITATTQYGRWLRARKTSPKTSPLGIAK